MDAFQKLLTIRKDFLDINEVHNDVGHGFLQVRRARMHYHSRALGETRTSLSRVVLSPYLRLLAALEGEAAHHSSPTQNYASTLKA